MGNLNTTCCLGCTSCNDCNDCMVSCKTCQAFCQIKQNSENGFEFSKCISSGEIIGPGFFSRDTWNEAIKRISKIFSKGEYSNAKNFIIEKNEKDTHMTADEFNRVSTASECKRLVNKDDIIYGTYFSELENAVANLNYKPNQCDSCNVQCDGGCNTCKSCENSCNSCNSECGQYCCSCNSCQGPA